MDRSMKLKGIPASPNIAIGKAMILKRELKAKRMAISESEVTKETARFEEAVRKSKEKLHKLVEKVSKEIGEDKAKIFQAHLLILEDPALLKEVEKKIRSGINADAAVQDAVKGLVSVFENLKNEYFRSRAVDIQDVGDRILTNLAGKNIEALTDLRQRVVLVAETFTPSDIANINKEKVLGFAADKGGMTSHVAIISREYGIPAVVGLCDATKNIETGDYVIVDGSQGLVIVNPDANTLKMYKSKRKRQEKREKDLVEIARLPTVTLDGRQIELAANIGELAETDFALSQGATSVGLFRTEFLYLGRKSLPTEHDQYRVYKAVAEKMGKMSVIIRTLDIGGDKPPPYLPLPQELNPFLGFRGLRISLDRPEIFKTQLRAILRASTHGNLKLMYPMVSCVEEIKKASQLLEEAKMELKSSGASYKDVETGIMIEVPSAAIIADILAEEVEFFSIGTNDLTQYTLAADRTNEKVSYLFDTFHPALLRLIKKVVDASHAVGKWTGLCGEFAGDPLATPILLGLGVDEFSMNASSLLEVKKTLRSIAYCEAQIIAKKALGLTTKEETRELAKTYLIEKNISLG